MPAAVNVAVACRGRGEGRSRPGGSRTPRRSCCRHRRSPATRRRAASSRPSGRARAASRPCTWWAAEADRADGAPQQEAEEAVTGVRRIERDDRGEREQDRDPDRPDRELERRVDAQRVAARADEARQEEAPRHRPPCRCREGRPSRRGRADHELEELEPDDFVDQGGRTAPGEEDEDQGQKREAAGPKRGGGGGGILGHGSSLLLVEEVEHGREIGPTTFRWLPPGLRRRRVGCPASPSRRPWPEKRLRGRSGPRRRGRRTRGCLHPGDGRGIAHPGERGEAGPISGALLLVPRPNGAHGMAHEEERESSIL